MKPRRIAHAGGVGIDGASAASVPTPPAVRGAGLPARRAALEVLLRVEREGAFADVLLGHRLAAFPDPADRHLVTKLVLATIAWQGRLDYELAHISSRKLEALAPEILAILRLGLCQLRILTRIPQHAAVDTAVTLARESCDGGRAAGFVNAVLRNALRKTITLPARSGDQVDYLAVTLSHPRWLVERFVAWFGVAAAEALMKANNEAAPNVLRLNLARGEPSELKEELLANCFAIGSSGRFAETVILAEAPSFDSKPLREGLCYPQSEASQLAVRMLAPPSGATVIDCAAAPGGKSTHLAELAGRNGKIIALDRSQSGLCKVASLASKLGHQNVLTVRADCAAALPLCPNLFDYVLLDAPCTGSGTLREHPEIRWRLRPDDFIRMAKLQLRMLEQASALVATGGVIVYAVCSVAPEEGEGVAGSFLANHPDFAVDRAIPLIERFAGLIGVDGFMRTRPDQGGLDGFFAARLIRRA
ncbi:MAG: 16S rRNA (cytosine(967)-C(5))-methyltransferase RsmB [Candidatus Binataceae bacterium]|jgi:16S rRNA (cytosine967-C5)-methyltransferase